MEKELTIGIYQRTNAIQEVLYQIGVSFSLIAPNCDIDTAQFSVVLINRPLSTKEISIVKNYTTSGGGLIDFGFCIDKMVAGKLRKKFIHSILSEYPSFIPSATCFDIFEKATTFSKASFLNKTLFIDEYGRGILSFLGIDYHRLLLNTKKRRKEFYSTSKRFPNEEVAQVSKGEISLLLFYLLRHLHLARNIPFIHKWFFPGKAENVFLFRIDSDYGTKKQVNTWYRLSQKRGIKCTWFIHTNAHQQWLSEFLKFENNEIAVHGHDHFFSNKSNDSNIEMAMYQLKKEGLTSKGYASPYGLCNNKLLKSVESFGFAYSSEFSYIYDSLPLRPILDNYPSPVLQIPIHPICIGSLLSAKMNDREIIHYFAEQIQNKMMNCQPLIFYDHVTHARPSLLKEIFMKCIPQSVRMLTFYDYASWWKSRFILSYHAVINENGKVTITLPKEDSEHFLCLWLSDKKYRLLNTSATISLDTRTDYFTIKTYSGPTSKDFRKIRSFNPRLIKLSLLNNLLWRNYR